MYIRPLVLERNRLVSRTQCRHTTTRHAYKADSDWHLQPRPTANQHRRRCSVATHDRYNVGGLTRVKSLLVCAGGNTRKVSQTTPCSIIPHDPAPPKPAGVLLLLRAMAGPSKSRRSQRNHTSQTHDTTERSCFAAPSRSWHFAPPCSAPPNSVVCAILPAQLLLIPSLLHALLKQREHGLGQSSATF